MRIRTVKPGAWRDEKIGNLSREARLLFIGLITQADDEGRFRALPSIIRGDVYPYDTDAERKIPRWMSELEQAGLVELYGEHFGRLPNWLKHQKISHPTPSILPKPSENGTNNSGGVPE